MAALSPKLFTALIRNET